MGLQVIMLLDVKQHHHLVLTELYWHYTDYDVTT